MPVAGQRVIADNIVKYGGRFLATVDKTMEEVQSVMGQKVTENISLTDHGPADFKRMDHPYAARHGVHGKPIHDPYYQVHIQTGRLRQSKKSGTIKASIVGGRLQAVAYVGLDQSIAPHALDVVFGTSRMIPRPVLEGSRQFVINDAKAILEKNLKGMTFNFKGQS